MIFSNMVGCLVQDDWADLDLMAVGFVRKTVNVRVVQNGDYHLGRLVLG